MKKAISNFFNFVFVLVVAAVICYIALLVGATMLETAAAVIMFLIISLMAALLGKGITMAVCGFFLIGLALMLAELFLVPSITTIFC